MAEPGAAGAAQPPRWLGLDALRGLSILAMILVNNPGRWGRDWQYAPLRHADWHGCTFTDLVFPTFLFCAGVAIVPATASRLRRGVARTTLVRAILARVAKLILLGMLLSAFPLVTFAAERGLFDPLLGTRFPGVLQRIGVCYGVAALLYLFTSVRTQRVVLWGCLLGYWLLISTTPGLGDLHAIVDEALFGTHIYEQHGFDPEGLLSTIPAVATCLFGVEAGRMMHGERDVATRITTLLRSGVLLLALGAIWSWFLPFNKYLWTSSYAVWTAGIATAGLGLCVDAFERRGWLRLAYPLQVYGTNALLVFIGSGIVGRVLASLIRFEVDGRTISLKTWLFSTVLQPLGSQKFASLLFALLWIGAWFVVLRMLYRRNLVWKV